MQPRRFLDLEKGHIKLASSAGIANTAELPIFSSSRGRCYLVAAAPVVTMMPVVPMMTVRHSGRRARDYNECRHNGGNNQQLFHHSFSKFIRAASGSCRIGQAALLFCSVLILARCAFIIHESRAALTCLIRRRRSRNDSAPNEITGRANRLAGLAYRN